MAFASKIQPYVVRNAKPKRKSKKSRDKELEEADEKSTTSWCRLPPDLTAKILNRLPLHHALNAMAVCKQWRAFLLQHSLNADAEGETLSPLFVSTSGSRVSTSWRGYHAASRRWVRYPNLAFLPFFIARVHSSHRGLLLVEAAGAAPCCGLYLCNFSTLRFWPLPSLSHSHDGIGIEFSENMYWCHCHLYLEEEMSGRFTVIALLRRSNGASAWPELVCFDSQEGSWKCVQAEVSLTLPPCKAFFEGVDRMVVLQSPKPAQEVFNILPSGRKIYIMVPGRQCSYLVKYDPVSSVWTLVTKLHFASAQIVAFQDTLVAVALDRSSRQMHLYRLVQVEEEHLVLEGSSGTEFAAFVDACALHFWYTTCCSSSNHVYVGVSLRKEAIINAQQEQPLLVEYEGLSKIWSHVPLPNDLVQNYGLTASSSSSAYSILCADAYHQLGLQTSPDCPDVDPDFY